MSTYTQEQYEAAPKWVKYEVNMLFGAFLVEQMYADRLGTAQTDQAREHARGVRTCALESFLIHYRNLKDFLNNRKFDTDVKAIDYAARWSGGGNVAETYPGTEDRRINQLLTHITYDRENLDRGNWDIPSMERNLRESLKRFLGQVDAGVSGKFDETRAHVRQREAVPMHSTSDGNRTDSVRTFKLWFD